MIDEVPEVARTLPVKASLSFAHRVGKKCVVTELGDGWICAHGTDGTGRPEEDDECRKVAPMGSIGVDPSQARVYYHPGAPSKALVIRPDYAAFRTSRKGLIEGRSKSFDQAGIPVPEVLLLYGLKTGREADRFNALFSFSTTFWVGQLYPSVHGYDLPYPTFGDIFKEIQNIAEDLYSYHLFIGRLMAQAGQRKDGLRDWALWEKVADAAVAESIAEKARSSGESMSNFNDRFFQAVKETTLEQGGLPSQQHVRERWEKLKGRGDWKDNRRKLGFDWLPPRADWTKDWIPLRKKIQGGSFALLVAKMDFHGTEPNSAQA